MARKIEIAWYYHRKGCTACAKAEEFLRGYAPVVHEQVDARRTRIGPSELGPIVKGAQRVLVSNGRTVARFEPGTKGHDQAEMLAKMIGPTGNLRAPTIRSNGLVVVGWHADSMKELAGEA